MEIAPGPLVPGVPSLVGHSAVPRPCAQEPLTFGSPWVCAAVLLAAVAVRQRLTRRASFIRGVKPSSRSANVYMKNQRRVIMRHPYWYGSGEKPRCPSWLKGYKPEKGEDGEDLPAPDEGSRPPDSIPKFADAEWWRRAPTVIKRRCPRYWRRIYKDDGFLRFKMKEPAMCTSYNYYSIPEAIDNIFAGFEGDTSSSDHPLMMQLKMGLDPKYPIQQIRTQVKLPNGLGSEKRVAVFCAPDEEKEMLDLGATLAGKTLQDEIEKEEFNFDVLITKPANMPAIAKLGKILGKRRLMPSPKSGTVVTDMAKAISTWKEGGTLELRGSPRMLISAPIGKQSQGKEKLVENARSLLQQLSQNCPPGAKKVKEYYLKIHLQADGPSIRIDKGEFPDHGYVAPREDDGLGDIRKRLGFED